MSYIDSPQAGALALTIERHQRVVMVGESLLKAVAGLEKASNLSEGFASLHDAVHALNMLTALINSSPQIPDVDVVALATVGEHLSTAMNVMVARCSAASGRKASPSA